MLENKSTNIKEKILEALTIQSLTFSQIRDYLENSGYSLILKQAMHEIDSLERLGKIEKFKKNKQTQYRLP